MNTQQAGAPTQMISAYEEAAIDFLKSTKTKIESKFLKNDAHFDDDKDVRDIYEVTIKRGDRSYTFNFGQSINKSQYYKDTIPGRTYTLNGKCRTGNYSINNISKYLSGGNKLILVKGEKPTNYDILCCLTKYNPGSKTYNSVIREWNMVCCLFTDAEIEQLQEI